MHKPRCWLMMHALRAPAFSFMLDRVPEGVLCSSKQTVAVMRSGLTTGHLQPGHRETAMLPTTYQTEPGTAEVELKQTGCKALHTFTQYPGGSCELWRVVVAARRLHVPLAQDPTLLAYAHTPPGITGVWANFRERPVPGTLRAVAERMAQQ